MLLCFLLSVSDSRTFHSHLNLLQGLQEPFLRLTVPLRKALSNMSLELWSDPEKLCLTFSAWLKDAHPWGFLQFIPSLQGLLFLLFLCVFLWQECSGSSPTACGRGAERSKTPSVTQRRSRTGGRRSATSRTARPGNGFWRGSGGVQ